MDRGNYQQWEDAGKPSLADRASAQVKELLGTEQKAILSEDLRKELESIMISYGKRFGLAKLPTFD
jgi:trimethylamine:corrinoid methyltransferase-like protein